MTARNRPVSILMADDDSIMRILFEEFAMDNPDVNSLEFVLDGIELLDRLMLRSEYKNRTDLCMPDFILLDISMPRMNGRDALEEMARHEFLTSIPKIVMTSYDTEEDINEAYDMGASVFLAKPTSMGILTQNMECLIAYWYDCLSNPEFELKDARASWENWQFNMLESCA
ncbi:MAG: response regulator [Cohaesibacteraceae bacterium]|nr:response regulator [Cohaesibacteraceae bacterium]